ncbi:MAG: hypothetical protein KG029_16940 [Bacteroidetes bacterium]|jgi:hypothetical protein|nr:hypothetical protein [Bacteroidota bacterium]
MPPHKPATQPGRQLSIVHVHVYVFEGRWVFFDMHTPGRIKGFEIISAGQVDIEHQMVHAIGTVPQKTGLN